MLVEFTKMEGAGNDFVMIDGLSQKLPEDIAAFSKFICHRQFGVGADQVLIVKESSAADFFMDIYNADGGRVEMCGNGIRCFLKFLQDKNLTKKNNPVIETLAGLIYPEMIIDHPLTTTKTSWVKVDMGEPILEAKNIPVNDVGQIMNKKWSPQKALELKEQGLPFEFLINCVSMGNPHCVIFVDDLKNYPVQKVGPYIETDPYFPNRVNVEFVEVVSPTLVKQRTWERGSGETLACGTGACAVAVASVSVKNLNTSLSIELKGGSLDIFWDLESKKVFKTGPATTVFEGTL